MRNLVRTTLFLASITVALAATASKHDENHKITSRKDQTTHELLSSLGLKKLRIPAAHSRKRFTEQGRRHASGDSRMFVIKLPPNTAYYNRPDPAPASARTLPLQMTGNGKPAKVYHWNIPQLHKMAKNRPQARRDDDDAVVNVEITPTWTKEVKHPNAIDGLSYYVPLNKPVRKYYSGNGRPKSFYVLKNNVKYHRRLRYTPAEEIVA